MSASCGFMKGEMMSFCVLSRGDEFGIFRVKRKVDVMWVRGYFWITGKERSKSLSVNVGVSAISGF